MVDVLTNTPSASDVLKAVANLRTSAEALSGRLPAAEEIEQAAGALQKVLNDLTDGDLAAAEELVVEWRREIGLLTLDRHAGVISHLAQSGPVWRAEVEAVRPWVSAQRADNLRRLAQKNLGIRRRGSRQHPLTGDALLRSLLDEIQTSADRIQASGAGCDTRLSRQRAKLRKKEAQVLSRRCDALIFLLANRIRGNEDVFVCSFAISTGILVAA